jgi:hypothetical protein
MSALLAALAVTIRVYDVYGLPPAQRQEALAVAAATLEDAGVQAAIVDCTPPRPAAACLAPLGPGELLLRLGRHPREGHDVLGEAVVHPDPEQCTLATVYAAAVAERARRIGVPVTSLVGRVAAHEIGHLLLGSPAHARDGLMRGAWDVQRRQPADWRFTREDAAAIRTRLTRREHGAPSLSARR